MKRILSVLLALMLMMGMCACGAGLPSAAVVPGTEEAGQTPAEAGTEKERYAEEFTTDDGLIQIRVQDEEADPIPESMPVLRIRPKTITASMARQIAKVLFGDAVLYEYSQEMTKEEIRLAIDAWERGVTDEAIREDYGADIDQATLESVRQARLEILEYYRNAYANAREEVSPEPCQWKFWPSEHYAIHGYDYTGADPSYTEDIPFGLAADLRAETTVGEIPYQFWVNNNESSNFRNHSLTVFIDEPEALFAQEAQETEARLREWYETLGLRSGQPATEQELEMVLEKAGEMLQNMGIGEWVLSAEAVQGQRAGRDWEIRVEGLPVYEGFPVAKQDQLSNLRGTEPGSQNCYYESLEMLFSNDGKLIRLDYYSPMEVAELVEPAASLMGREQVEPIALDNMRAWEYGDLLAGYAPEQENSWWNLASITEFTVDITSVRVGYARVKYDETDFLLVPCISFRGDMQVLGTMEGVWSQPHDLLMGEETYHSLLVLDLRDGSPLRVRNPVN